MFVFLKKNKSGFTIIELIVVFSVISILSSYLILYNKTSESQIALSLEQSKIINLINQAKSLAISTYLSPNPPCGYGVKINYVVSTYELFSYGQSPNCYSIDINNQADIKTISSNNLPKELQFTQSNDYLDAIFYIPPYPKILIWKNNNLTPIDETSSAYEAKIYLKTKDGSLQKEIKVNIAGQISF